MGRLRNHFRVGVTFYYLGCSSIFLFFSGIVLSFSRMVLRVICFDLSVALTRALDFFPSSSCLSNSLFIWVWFFHYILFLPWSSIRYSGFDSKSPPSRFPELAIG